MENTKLSFAEWLEEYVGVTWSYYDNNYDGRMADEVWEDYMRYCEE